MTEKEFFQQVWRPYDTVTVEGSIKGRVHSVCFSTRSVRLHMAEGAPEWFRCDLITDHHSATGESTDLAIIEEQYQKLQEASVRIEKLAEDKKQLEERLRENYAGDIRKNVNIILATCGERKRRINKLEDCMLQLLSVMEKIGSEEESEL